MANVWKSGIANTIGIDLGPFDIYNASGFKLFYKHKDDVNTTLSNATFTEVMHNIPAPVTCTVSVQAEVGDTEVTVANATNIQVGMVLKTGSIYVYVNGKVGNILYLRRPLTNSISTSTVLTEAGNTGYYETALTLTTLGQYSLIISNPTIGLLNEVTKVEIVANTVDDIYSKVNADNIGINSKLDGISSAVGSVDVSISGKMIL